ncbi:MAG: hypothetical protein NWF09_06255 [Candidatus Bathyarchaeota archaeon]|nr:hypothetical protein [Candidatus Bathyarchaeota archaeon]
MESSMRRCRVIFVLAFLLSTFLLPCFSADSVTIWVRELGEIDLGMTRSVIRTADGGFAVVGSKDGGFLLMKLDHEGNLEWERVYGAKAEFASFANDALQTPDGGFLLAGRGTPWPHFMGPNGTLFNLIKVDAHGNLEWERLYGTRSIEDPFVAYSIVESSGGYTILGYSESNWSPIASGSCRIVLIKIDEQGNVQWRCEYPIEVPYANAYVTEADDGGYFILTLARFYYYNHFCYDDWDYVLIRTDPEGNIIWKKLYNYTRSDDPKALLPTSDGGFVLAGNVIIHEDKLNYSVIKVNKVGEVEWNRVYSGFLCSATTLKDEGYLLATKSLSGGVILKITTEGEIEWSVKYEGGDEPAIIPYHVVETMDDAYAFTGAKVDNPQVKVLVKFKPQSPGKTTEPSKDYMALPATITAVVATTSIIIVTIIINLKKKGRKLC